MAFFESWKTGEARELTSKKSGNFSIKEGERYLLENQCSVEGLGFYKIYKVENGVKYPLAITGNKFVEEHFDLDEYKVVKQFNINGINVSVVPSEISIKSSDIQATHLNYPQFEKWWNKGGYVKDGQEIYKIPPKRPKQPDDSGATVSQSAESNTLSDADLHKKMIGKLLNKSESDNKSFLEYCVKKLISGLDDLKVEKGNEKDNLMLFSLTSLAAIELLTGKKDKQILGEIHETYKKKNADYGNSFSDQFKEFGMTSTLIRLTDKVSRLEQLVLNNKQRQVNDESVEDTFRDALNYALMTLMELEKQEK